jgi:hypothetical protein
VGQFPTRGIRCRAVQPVARPCERNPERRCSRSARSGSAPDRFVISPNVVRRPRGRAARCAAPSRIGKRGLQRVHARIRELVPAPELPRGLRAPRELRRRARQAYSRDALRGIAGLVDTSTRRREPPCHWCRKRGGPARGRGGTLADAGDCVETRGGMRHACPAVARHERARVAAQAVGCRPAPAARRSRSGKEGVV